MNLTLTGWSPVGVVAGVLIVAGIVLLAAYVLRRGLHTRDLDGTEPEIEPGAPAHPAVASRTQARSLGVLGAALLSAGLLLGVASAAGGWGNGTVANGGPGAGTPDCAQAWNGCPQATAQP